MPANHKAVLAFRARDGGDYRRIAAGIGENTVRFIDGMLKSGPIEEQFYKSCNGILFGFRSLNYLHVPKETIFTYAKICSKIYLEIYNDHIRSFMENPHRKAYEQG